MVSEQSTSGFPTDPRPALLWVFRRPPTSVFQVGTCRVGNVAGFEGLRVETPRRLQRSRLPGRPSMRWPHP